jgi:TP901 family phage tail tape measure protein
MADVNANIGVHIDTSAALAELKNLQRQLATFHSSVAKNSAAAAAAQKGLQTNLLNSINATGKFRAQMGLVRTSTESFTHALETNKLSMREYFRYAGGSTKTFGRLFKQEFNTIGKVAEERVKKMQTQYIKMGRDASGAMKAISITPNTLNMQDYSTKLAVAAQKQALLNQLLKQGSTNLLNFGKNTQWAGRQLMVGFTIPLAYFGTAAAKTFMDLEKQAVNFKRVYGDMFTTSDQTNKALADVQELAKQFTKYGIAVVDTMEMAAKAAAMGKTGADLTAQVSEATRLAVLGGVEQTQALETTISVTNAFGVAADDLKNKINFLNAVENQTVVSIEDLTEAIPKAGPVVKQLGGTVEDLAFFLTAMKEGGINASEGANALKSGLASLINPSKKASEMLANMGINIKGIVESNAGNIRETVIDFAKALDTLDPLNRARAIEQLFGKFQFSRLSTLFQNVTKDGTQASKVLQLAGASIEELAILSERELGTIENAVGVNFKESIEKLKLSIAPIGKTFLEAVTPIVQVVGRLLDKFNNLGEGTKKFIVVATTLVGVIGPVLLMTFGLLANGIANIIKLFITMRSGFLKAGTNTSLLAQQTQYLNSEQLESATVAASLNQAHTRLTQSFGAEATAVRLLRQAYIDATVAATRFAMANPGMMMPGTKFNPKKFNLGTKKVPGYSKGTDSVPAMLTPGEAVIPANIAQNNTFKPIVQALVDGTIQGFEAGTVNVGGKSFATRSQSAGRSLENKITELRSKGISEEKIVKALETNIERGRPMTASQLERRLSINRGTGSGTSAPSGIRSLAKKSQSGFAAETDAIRNNLRSQGVILTSAQEKNLFNVQASHIEEVRNSGTKEWNAKNLVADLGYVNNYLNTVKGKLGQNLLAMSDDQLKSMGIDRNELKKLQSGTHPTTAAGAQTLRSVAAYDAKINPNSYQAKAVIAGLEHRSSTNFYSRPMKTLAGTSSIKTGSTIVDDIRKIQQARYNKEDSALLEAMGSGKRSGVVSGQTGIARSSALGVIGGGSSDTRQIAVGKGESILTKKTTSSLRAGKGVFIPGMGRLGIVGAEGGIPAGQTQGGTREIPFSSTSGVRIQESQMNKLIESLDKNTETLDDGTKITTKLTKDQKREVRANRAGAVGRVSGPVAGLAGVGAMAGFASGNANIGMAAMGISALASVAPMLTNPLGLFVAGLVSITAVIYKFNRDVEKARKEGVNLADAMSMTSKKIIDLSALSGTVSASEAAARKRKDMVSGTGEGQRQYGQNILQSDFGKQILTDIETQSKNGKSTKEIAQNLANNLAVAVAQGAVTTSQARSISAALGEKLGSYEIPALISGKLINLLGPDGENLTKDPLQVTLQIQQDSINKEVDLFKTAIKGISLNNTEFAKTAFNIFDLKTYLPGFLSNEKNKIEGNKTKLTAAAVQLAVQEVAQNQGLVDSLNKQYDLKLKAAKTEQEIKRIEDERKISIAQLNTSNAKALNILIKQKDQLGVNAFNKGIKAAADVMYKEGPMAVFKDQAIKELDNFKNSDFKTTLQIGLASGQVGPTVISKILSTIAGSKGFETSFKLLVDKQGMADAALVAELLPSEGGSDSTRKLMVDYINNNKEDFSKDIEALTVLKQINPTYGITLDLTSNGVDQVATTLAALKQIESIPGDKLTKDIVAGLAEKNPGEWKTFYDQWTVLSEGKDSVNKNLKIAFDVVSKDPNFKGFGSSAGIDAAKIIAKGDTLPGPLTGATGEIVDPKPRLTYLDELLKKLKLTRNASINALGGIDELRRVMNKSGGDIKIFKGISQQLKDQGFNEEFINFINDLDPAIQKKFITIKNGIVTITKDGKALAAGLNEAVLGELQAGYDLQIQGLKAQSDKFIELKAAGLSAAEALSIVTNEQVALAFASGTAKKEIDVIISKLRELRTQETATLKATDPAQYIEKQVSMALEYYDVLERETRNTYQPQIDAINNLIDANEKLIDVKQREVEINYDRPIAALNAQSTTLNHDLSLIDKAAESINKKYDEQEKALSQISDISDQIAEQEKRRITIADALTQGDISAAAKAIQDERQASAKAAQETSSNLLQAAREKELSALKSASGLTRLEIENKLYTISEQTYVLEQKQIPVLEEIKKLQDTNYNYQVNSLAPLQAKLDAELLSLDAQRKKWTDIQLGVDGAKVRSKEYNDVLLNAEDTLRRMKLLWDDIGKSSIKSGTSNPVSSTIIDPQITKVDSIAQEISDKVTNMTVRELAKYGGNTVMAEQYLTSQKINEQGLGPKYAGMLKGMFGMSVGGMVPKYFASGGYSKGTDTIPTMLTPGEFIVRKNAVDSFGVNNLNKINDGSYGGSSVYNYSLNVNVKSDANPNDIARTVMTQIKQIDNQRIRIQRGA